jgi:hypothetical protein
MAMFGETYERSFTMPQHPEELNLRKFEVRDSSV